jgi:hypothetical protein
MPPSTTNSSFASNFPAKILYAFLAHAGCHMSCPSHPPWFNHSNNIWRWTEIVKCTTKFWDVTPYSPVTVLYFRRQYLLYLTLWGPELHFIVSPVSSFLSGPDIPYGTVFYHLSLCSSLNEVYTMSRSKVHIVIFWVTLIPVYQITQCHTQPRTPRYGPTVVNARMS